MRRVLMLGLLLAALTACSSPSGTTPASDVVCPENQGTVPTCEQVCNHTTTLGYPCNNGGDFEICLQTCRQVFDTPTREAYERLRICYLTAKSCEEIAGCNQQCHVTPPIPVPDAADQID